MCNEKVQRVIQMLASAQYHIKQYNKNQDDEIKNALKIRNITGDKLHILVYTIYSEMNMS